MFTFCWSMGVGICVKVMGKVSGLVCLAAGNTALNGFCKMQRPDQLRSTEVNKFVRRALGGIVSETVNILLGSGKLRRVCVQ